MRLFCTGASGFIGGSVAAALVSAGQQVIGLVRSQKAADDIRKQGFEPILGTLDDLNLLAEATRAADAVVNAAMLEAMAASGKTFIHTSGSSIVGTRAGGEPTAAIHDETTPFIPSPARVARVALNQFILSTAKTGLRPIIICPSLIYGQGRGIEPHSMQVPWLIKLADKNGVAKYIGSGGTSGRTCTSMTSCSFICWR